jgi:hypothetical protein
MAMPGVYGIPGGYPGAGGAMPLPTQRPAQPPGGAGIGPVIGSIAGTAVDAWSNWNTNKSNAANVDKQLAFQQQQSETQWQRAVEDMKKAGLNPALAYEKGGNSTQSGAASTNTPLTQNTGSKIGSALQLYNDFANSSAQRGLVREQTNAAAAQSHLIEAQEQNTRYDSALKFPMANLSQTGDYGSKFREKIMAGLAADTYTSGKTAETWQANIANLGAGTARAQAAAKLDASQTTLNEQNFQTAFWREKIQPYLNNSAALMASAGEFKDMLMGTKLGEFLKPKDIPKDPTAGKSYDETRTNFKGGSHTTRQYR